MNIFALDDDPVQAAQWLVDKHTVKMPLESAQMLANCFDPVVLESEDCPRTIKGEVRKHSYYNHPCSIWVRSNQANTIWLCDHAVAIDAERVERYNSSPHASLPFILWVRKNLHRSVVPLIDPLHTKFAQAMPEEFKQESSIQAYRDYYAFGKQHLHQWKRNKPHWI